MFTLHRTVFLLFVVKLLSACGGGGAAERTLLVDFTYSPNYTYLWRETSIDISASGLEGNAPVCVTSSTHPFSAGLAFAPNSCRIVGTPTDVASGTVMVRLTVPGFSGQVEKPITFSVLGPPIDYSVTSPLDAGSAVNFRPYSAGDVAASTSPWTPTLAESIGYSVASGELPAGLKLDPRTGAVAGLATKFGFHQFSIGVRAESAGRVYEKRSQPITIQVSDSFAFYYQFSSPPYVGLPFSVPPSITYPPRTSASDFRLSNYRIAPGSQALPQGLALDSVTGAISGVLATSDVVGPIVVQVDVSRQGQVATLSLSPPLTFYASPR